MITSFHRHLRACLILLFLGISPPVLASEEDGTAHFSCSPWQKLTETNLLYRVGKDYLPIAISGFTNRSQLYPLKGMAELELYILAVDDEGVETYKLMGKAAFPDGTNRALFFIDEKKTKEGLPLTVFGMDDSLKSFPPGTFRFFNFTPKRMHIAFGGKVRKLNPNGVKTVKANASDNGEFIPFLIEDIASKKVIYETRLIGQPSGRNMVFIGSPSNPGSNVTVKFLSEVVPPAPPAAE